MEVKTNLQTFTKWINDEWKMVLNSEISFDEYYNP